MGLWASFTDAIRDATLGWRQLKRNLGFTLLAVVSLAVAMGGTMVAYGLIDRWLLRELPFPDAQRLVIVLRSSAEHPAEAAYFPNSRDLDPWRQSRSFGALAGVMWRRFGLTGRGDPEPVEGMVATPNFFATLGVHAARGRTFAPSDARDASVVVLSHAFWANRLGAEPDVIGQSLVLDGRPHQVIGVMPPEFDFRMLNQQQSAQLWVITAAADTAYGPTGSAPLAGLGRLRASASVASATMELNAIQRETNARFVGGLRGSGVVVEPLQENTTRTIRSTLLMFGAVAALVLIIASVNLASLLIGRGLAREGEFAVRVAIGSGRRRLIAQLLTENLLLGVLGAVGGLAIAWTTFPVLGTLNPFESLPPGGLGVDISTIALAAAVPIASVCMFGLLPAVQITRIDARAALAAGGRVGERSGTRHARRTLVVAQLALTLVLIVAAALLGGTLRRLNAEPTGFDPTGVAIAAVDLPAHVADSATRAHELVRRLQDALAAQPGVTTVGFSTYAVLFGGTSTPLRIEGEAAPNPDEAQRLVAVEVVSSNYLQALGVRLLRGRALSDQDRRGGEPVAVINQQCADAWFGQADPIGRRLILDDTAAPRRVVGVVATTASSFYNRLAWQRDPRVYVPASQVDNLAFSPVAPEVWFAIRSLHRLELPEVRRIAAQVNGEAVVLSVDPLGDLLAEATRQARGRSILLSVCAVATLLLAALGVFGVMSEAVVRRRREIGIRVAVGARADQVAASILREGLALAVGGIVVGAVGALAIGRALAGVLYGVMSSDPITLAGAGTLLLIVALLATWIPARRASQTDPVRAMRGQ